MAQAPVIENFQKQLQAYAGGELTLKDMERWTMAHIRALVELSGPGEELWGAYEHALALMDVGHFTEDEVKAELRQALSEYARSRESGARLPH